MKLAATLAALLLSACSTIEPQFDLAAADQLIDYPVQSDQYIIVVVEEGGISAARARKMALQRAAELTAESGNRYYTIVSEEKTLVVKTYNPDTQAVSGNQYEEVIVEQSFDKNSLQNQTPYTGEKMVPALRITIQCYQQKPNKKSYDACKSAKGGNCLINFRTRPL